MAAPTFLAAGSNPTTATIGSLTVPLPAGIVDGDFVQVEVFTQPASAGAPAAPAGWTQRVSVVGGLGTEGVDDQGTRRVTIYTPTDPAVAPTTAPVFAAITGQTAMGGNSVAYRVAVAGDQWSTTYHDGTYAAITDAKPVPPAYAAWSTGAAALATDDVVLAATIINTDGAGAGSGRSITAAGITFATHATRGAALVTAAANDSRLDLGDSVVTAGSATATLKYAAAYTTTVVAGASPSGATAFTRLREVTPPPSNTGPTATLTISQVSAIEPGTTITITVGGSDPDGTISAYALTSAGLTGGTLTKTDTTHWSYLAPLTLNGGNVTFTATVTDNSGATGTTTGTASVLGASIRAKQADGSWAPVRVTAI